MTLSPDVCATARQRFLTRVILTMISSAALSSCGILLPDNVKGSFVCSAPSGTCAPSTVIDDQAIAMIEAARPQQPAALQAETRRYSPARVKGKASALSDTGYTRHRDVARMSDNLAHRGARTLRVVFPAFVDEAGNLHEARVIHTVVDQGGWAQLSEDLLAPAPAGDDAIAQNVTADPASALPAPTAAPSASIRLPKAQPDAAYTIEAIRAQVAERLSGARMPAQKLTPATAADAAPAVAKQTPLKTRSSAPEDGGDPAKPSTITNAPATFAGPAGE